MKELYASGQIPLCGHNSIFICPSATKPPTVPPSLINPFFNYGFNNRLDPNGPDSFKRQQVALPSEVVAFTENQGQPPYATSSTTQARHSNLANIGLVDGHAEPIARKEYTFTGNSALEWSTTRRVYWYPFSGAVD